MKTNFKVLVAALIFVATVSSAMAEYLYGAVDIGQSNGKDICTGLPAGVNGCQDTGTLIRIAGGFQISPMWGVEASFGDLGNQSVGTGFGATGNWKATALQVSGIGTFLIANGFSIIGKLGIVRADLEVSGNILGTGFDDGNTTDNVAYGIGAQYDLDKNTAIRAQYEDLGTIGDANTTGTSKFTLLSVGVLYRFY